MTYLADVLLRRAATSTMLLFFFLFKICMLKSYCIYHYDTSKYLGLTLWKFRLLVGPVCNCKFIHSLQMWCTSLVQYTSLVASEHFLTTNYQKCKFQHSGMADDLMEWVFLLLDMMWVVGATWFYPLISASKYIREWNKIVCVPCDWGFTPPLKWPGQYY